MKRLYCSQCGKLLRFHRKAVNGTVIDCVDPHECVSPPLTPEEALKDMDLDTNIATETVGLGSFVEALDRKFPPTSTPPHVEVDNEANKSDKTTAPKNILEQLKKNI